MSKAIAASTKAAIRSASEVIALVVRPTGPWESLVGCDARARSIGSPDRIAAGGRARGPAGVDEPAHRPDPLERGVVVEAIARGSPRRRDDPVAPLPGTEEGNGDAGTSSRLS